MSNPADRELSDLDRERTIERLRGHVGSGELTLAQFEGRVDQTLAARTGAELEVATSGLPVIPVARDRRAPRRWIVSVFGGGSTRGRWRVAGRLRSVAAFGGSDIDLRSAEFDSDEITIVATAFCGGDEIYLPDSVEVELTGGALFGGNDLHGGGPPPRPGAPKVRVRALSLFGGVDVYRLPADAADLPLREARKLARGPRTHRRMLP